MQRRALSVFGRRLSLVVLGVMVLGMAITLVAMQIGLPFPGVRAQEDEVDIWVLGVEFKGTAGAGEPHIDEGDKVERYVFVPDKIVVQQGQHVHLHFLGINGGGGHTVIIENYVTTPFQFFRNQTVTKEFVADEAGVFKIVCSDHPPTMTGELIVETSSVSAVAGIDPVSVTILGAQAALFVVTLVIVLLRRR
jgi:plastocyanin